MKCVIDTSAVSWLERVGRLELLSLLYNEIYLPPGVAAQLKNHHPTEEFVDKSTLPLVLKEKDQKRFDKLTKRWFKKLNCEDPVDIEVFIAYKFFLEVDEMVYANKGAENLFFEKGRVRDIYNLYELAEAMGKFSRFDSIQYIDTLIALNYRTQEMLKLKQQISHKL